MASPAPAPSALSLRGAVALSGRFPVLAGVDLEVAAGETVLVDGPNGAGKTSLLRVCAGLIPLASGRIAVLAVVAGTAAFAGIGLTLAGNLRGEVNLAASNGLYLVLLLVGGVLFPLDRLPAPLEWVGRGLPTYALSDVLRDALMSSGNHVGSSWLVLMIWAVVAPTIAATTFRWN